MIMKWLDGHQIAPVKSIPQIVPMQLYANKTNGKDVSKKIVDNLMKERRQNLAKKIG